MVIDQGNCLWTLLLVQKRAEKLRAMGRNRMECNLGIRMKLQKQPMCRKGVMASVVPMEMDTNNAGATRVFLAGLVLCIHSTSTQ